MAAPKGNQFWKVRSSHGRNPIYKKPADLQDAIYQYFDWNTKNPLIEVKPMIEMGMISDANIPRMRAMTITACARFCGMTHETWIEYRDKKGFSEVIKEAEDIIRDQKFAGAAAGFLNANIIARDLGLKDGVDVTSGGKKIKNEWHIHPVKAADAKKG